MGTGTRARFDKLVIYIQKNYRAQMNGKDYEFLQEIVDNYSSEEIFKAIEYSKQKSDSLVFLQKVLKFKYYQKAKEEAIEPEWFNEKIEREELSEKDKKYARSYYKKYCDTEEEYHERLRDNGLEE